MPYTTSLYIHTSLIAKDLQYIIQHESFTYGILSLTLYKKSCRFYMAHILTDILSLFPELKYKNITV